MVTSVCVRNYDGLSSSTTVTKENDCHNPEIDNSGSMLNIQRVTENTILFTSPAMQVNATLVMHEGRFILVDSMIRPEDSHEIRSFLAERNLPLDYIVNTH